jgi:hypothetical protein
MFIRQKERPLRKAYKDGGGVLRKDWIAVDFVLVANVRTDAGPRQRHVGYIGTLEQRLLDHCSPEARECARRVFYRDAIPRLKKLVPHAKEYQRLLKSLEARVGLKVKP